MRPGPPRAWPSLGCNARRARRRPRGPASWASTSENASLLPPPGAIVPPPGGPVDSPAYAPSVSPARFADLAAASERIAATRSRLEKTRILVELLGSIDPVEIAPAVGWLVQEPTSGPLGAGPAQLW